MMISTLERASAASFYGRPQYRGRQDQAPRSHNSQDSIRDELEVISYSFLQLLSGLVECIYFGMVFRYESHVNGLRIGLPFFEPEKMSFAITKTFQVWVSIFTFVVYKGCDPKWLQSLGIESD